jgi:hypothetical protein
MLSDKYSLRDTGLITVKANFVTGHVKRMRTHSKLFRPTPSAVAANMDTDKLFPKSKSPPSTLLYLAQINRGVSAKKKDITWFTFIIS